MRDKLIIVLLVLSVSIFAVSVMWFNHGSTARSNDPLPVLTQDQKADNEIKYFQDARTRLCFAGNFNSWNHIYVITNVPCTPEVLELVKPLP